MYTPERPAEIAVQSVLVLANAEKPGMRARSLASRGAHRTKFGSVRR